MQVDFAFLDSGLGGLPYLRYLRDEAPFARCVYLADTKHFPYGEKTAGQIIACAEEAVRLVIKRWRPRAIVVACNTISVTALDVLRRRFPNTPFIGTVPAIKPAAFLSKIKKIGVLATNATIHHPYTQQLIDQFAHGCEVVFRADPELIDFIERRAFNASEAEKNTAIEPALNFFRSAGCDSIVLACPHFLNIADEIKAMAGDGIFIVDSREGVIRRALEVAAPLPPQREDAAPQFSLYVTGFQKTHDAGEYARLCAALQLHFGGLAAAE